MTEPTNAQIFLSGDIPKFAWKADDYANGQRAELDLYHQLFWFESTDGIPNAENYYYRFPKSEESCGGGSRPDPRDRTGKASACYYQPTLSTSIVDKNSAAVRYRRRNRTCTGDRIITFGDPVDFFVVTPTFLPPLPTGDYFACEDGTVEISVDIVDALNPKDVNNPIPPTSIVWSKLDPLAQAYIPIYNDVDIADKKSTLNYDLGSSFAGSEVFRIIAYWKNNTCEVFGKPLTITVNSAVSLPLNPPQTQIFTSCEDQQRIITIPNPYNYTGVFWYEKEQDALAGTPVIHDGFVDTLTQSQGFRSIWVQYYKTLESGCNVKSAPVPLFFIGKPNKIFLLNLERGSTIQDHRNYNDLNCNSQDPARPTYHDLPLPNKFLTEIEDGFDASLGSQCFDFQINSTELKWEVTSSSDATQLDWTETIDAVGNDVYRVCAEHIRTPNGPYGHKTYQLVAYLDAVINAKSCGVDDTDIPLKCRIPIRGGDVTVYVDEPGEITDNECVAPSPEIINSMVNSYAPCDNIEIEEVCSNGKLVELGPSTEEVKEYFFGVLDVPENFEDLFTYEWIPGGVGDGWTNDGLSSSDIANPTLSYDDIEKDDGQIAHYVCKITFIGAGAILATEMIHCAYVYKCSKCRTDQIKVTTIFD